MQWGIVHSSWFMAGKSQEARAESQEKSKLSNSNALTRSYYELWTMDYEP
jgi:hypothetical protein